MLIRPKTSSAQNEIAAVSADGSTDPSLWSPNSNLRDGDGGDRFDLA
jgi:hypothetical protein